MVPSRVSGQTHNVGQLGLGHEILCFGAHELLLEGEELGTLGLLCLELGNLVGNLGLVVAARLDALFGIANLLEKRPAVVEIVCVEVFLFTHLGKQDADLVGDVADRIIVGLLSPVRELRRNGDTLLSGGLVVGDEMIFRLDQLEELATEFRLNGTTKGRETEAMATRGALFGALVGADRQGAIPIISAGANERGKFLLAYMVSCGDLKMITVIVGSSSIQLDAGNECLFKTLSLTMTNEQRGGNDDVTCVAMVMWKGSVDIDIDIDI